MTNIGQWSINELITLYRHDLFDDFLPFMDRYVVDHELGGFCCHCDRDGTRLSGEKDSWYEGRGIWVYSFLYRHFGQDTRHLEIARKGVEFVLAARPGDDPRWPRKMSREGAPLVRDREIYGSLFIAEGLIEYAGATGDARYRDLALPIIRDMIAIYRRPDYIIDMAGYNLGFAAESLPGARVQGAPMVLLRLATQLLREGVNSEFEELSSHSLQDLLERHWNPSFQLNNELRAYDYSVPANDYAQFAYTGHTLEAMWMVMDEALRRNDQALFARAAERFRRHVEVSWDDIYGGVFRGIRHVDRNEWLLDRVLWVQEEVLIGCLLLIENRPDPWAEDRFQRMYSYVRAHYPLVPHGLPLWINAADRKVTFQPHYNRVENYHHPRHLMLNLLALQRLAAASQHAAPGEVADHN